MLCTAFCLFQSHKLPPPLFLIICNKYTCTHRCKPTPCPKKWYYLRNKFAVRTKLVNQILSDNKRLEDGFGVVVQARNSS